MFRLSVVRKIVAIICFTFICISADAQMEFCGKFRIAINSEQKETLQTTMADCWTFEIFDDDDFKDIEYRKKSGVTIKFANKDELKNFVEKLLVYGKAKKKELEPCVIEIKEKDDEWKGTKIKIDQFDRLLHFSVTKYPMNGEGIETSTTLLNLDNLKQILKELK